MQLRSTLYSRAIFLCSRSYILTQCIVDDTGETGYLNPEATSGYSAHNITLSDAMTTDWRLDEVANVVYGLIEGVKVFWYMPEWQTDGGPVLWYSEDDVSSYYLKLECAATTTDDGESSVACQSPEDETLNVLTHCYDSQAAREYLALYREDNIPAACEKISISQVNAA